MSVSVELSGGLAQASGVKSTKVDAAVLREALERLAAGHGEDFRSRLFDQNGNPRRFINIYVNGRDCRFLNRLDTVLHEGDTISLIPAVSGG